MNKNESLLNELLFVFPPHTNHVLKTTGYKKWCRRCLLLQGRYDKNKMQRMLARYKHDRKMDRQIRTTL